MTRQAQLLALLTILLTAAAASAAEPPAWTAAHRQGPLSVDETRQFMRALADYAAANHLKNRPDSAQHGMMYEYFFVERKGQVDQYIQGEGLDTMHDGAWFCAALAAAYHATGDIYYRDFLVRWPLPFYLKMLNHSDELFVRGRSDARPDAKPWGKEWAFQGTKGFVPYFWDDGASVSLDRRISKRALGDFPCVDNLAGRANPDFRLDGYSLGSSNHMAQDLGVLVQTAWLLLRNEKSPDLQSLAKQTAEAARNLHAARMKHYGYIPMCVAPAALVSADVELMKRVPGFDVNKGLQPDKHYFRTFYDYPPGQKVNVPGFADDQEYRYYYGLAKHGGQVPPDLALRTIYDAYTVPMLYRAYCDDEPAPAGINVFDLHQYHCVDGKPSDYRSDRKGPFGQAKPIGSRMGPQNMVCTGWALQMLRAWPDLWETPVRRDDLRVYIDDPVPVGENPPAPKAKLALGNAALELVSSRTAFTLEGTFIGPKLTVKLYSRPDGKGAHAILTLDGNAARVENDRQEPLLHEARVEAATSTVTFRVSVPYTLVKGQKAWANGVEHARYSIAVNDTVRNIHLASSAAMVRARLEYELGCGLRTWQAVFKHYSYIPTGIGTNSVPVGPGVTWERFSDNGGYAHLISAAAQWINYQAGRCDWELQKYPGGKGE